MVADVDLRDLEMLIPCPNCEYELFCLIAEVQAGIFVWCPACRNLIQLRDQDASITSTESEIGSAVRDLLKGFK
jgi:hypothetical protein